MPIKTIDVLLEEMAISIEELAERAAMPPDRVAAVADGRWTPSPADREKLAAALGVPLADISWGHTMNPRNVRYHRFGLKEDFS
jgi:ribosome-binding protein aMBF1 (putative translation factor)